MKIRTIGIDLGKTTFHLVDAWRPRQDPAEEEALTEGPAGMDGQSASAANRPRSLFRIAFLNTSTPRARVRCAADPGTVRKTFSEVKQE